MNFDLEHAPASHAYKLLTGLVAPRPIALITSLDENGLLNAAPFSAYNYLCTDPPIVGIGISDRPGEAFIPKDTARNIRRTGEFVINVVTEDIAERMSLCSTDFPPEISEVEVAGFTPLPSQSIKTPRLAEAHAALECRVHTALEIGRNARIILGQVVSIYVDDEFVIPKGPYIKAEEMQLVGRMNGLGNYTHTKDSFFAINRISYADWKAGQK